MIHDRCKPGDHALVIGPHKGKNIGIVVLVVSEDGRWPPAPELGTAWRVRSLGRLLNVRKEDGSPAQQPEATGYDAWLMPLRPDQLTEQEEHERSNSHHG